MCAMPRKRKLSLHPEELGPGGTTVAGMGTPDRPLTEMQRKFVTHLVDDKMNHTAAARMAGFSQPHTAANYMLQSPSVKRAITDARLEYARVSGQTKQKVIDGFAEAIDMARIKADPIAMIAGWREIGKMCGFYEPVKTKVEVSVSGQVMLSRLNSMTDQELLALVDGSIEALEGEFSVVSE
jgi:phage terminase small subunit